MLRDIQYSCVTFRIRGPFTWHSLIYEESYAVCCIPRVDYICNLVLLDTAAAVKMVMFAFTSLINSILTLNLNIKCS